MGQPLCQFICDDESGWRGEGLINQSHPTHKGKKKEKKEKRAERERKGREGEKFHHPDNQKMKNEK